MSHAITGKTRRLRKISSPEVLLVALACVAAFIGAAWTSSSVFERLPHTEDESAFLFQAQTIASGRIVADAPEQPGSFSIPFIIVREGMWFGKYPPGYPAVLAIGVLAGAPWLVNATFAGLCVLLVYLLARRLYGVPAAAISAILLLVSPFFLLQAGSLLSHVVSLFWTLLFILLYSLARTNTHVLYPVAAGLTLGMLFITRPLTAVGVALPFVIWTVITIARTRRLDHRYVLIVLAAVPFLAGYAAYNDLTTGSPFRSAYELWWPFDRIGFGEDIGINGHDFEDGLRNTRANANALAAFLFGWPGRMSLVPAFAITISSLLAVVAGVRRRRQRRGMNETGYALSAEGWDLVLAGVVIGVVAVHIFYWTPGQMYGPRYFMETIGPLAILSGRCFERLAVRFAALLRHYAPQVVWPRRVSFAVIGAVMITLTLYAHLVWAPPQFDRFRGWNGITAEGLEAFDRYDVENAVVLVERETWTDYAPFFTRNTPSLDSDVIFASNRSPAENQRLMQIYPDRSFYFFSDGELVQVSAPD